MAQIRNTLILEDRITKVLKDTDTFAKNVLSTFKELKQVGDPVASTANSLRHLSSSVGSFQTSAAKAVAQMRQMVAQAARLTRQAQQLGVASGVSAPALPSAPSTSPNPSASAGAGILSFFDKAQSFGGIADGIVSNLGMVNPVLGGIAAAVKFVADVGIKAAKSIVEGFKQVIDIVGKVAAAVKKLYDVFEAFTQYTDRMRATLSRFQILGGVDMTQANAAYEELYAVSMRTYSSMEQTANIVNRSLAAGIFTTSERLQEALGFAETLNKALLVSGTSAAQAASAVEQLMQGLGAGQLYWADLRIVMQQAPGLALILSKGLQNVADQFGYTVQNLRTMSAEGTLTAEVILAAFNSMEDEINEMFGAFPLLFSRLQQNWATVWDKVLTDVDRVYNGLDGINAKLEEFNNWLLESAEGQAILDGISRAIAFILQGVEWLLIQVQNAWNWMIDNKQAVVDALMMIAQVAVIVGAIMFFSFLWANIPLILLIFLFYDAEAASVDASGSIWDTMREMGTKILTMIFQIWNVIVFVVYMIVFVIGIIWDVVYAVVATIITLVAWFVEGILALIWLIYTGWHYIMHGVSWIAAWVVLGIQNAWLLMLKIWFFITEAIASAFSACFMAVQWIVATVVSWIIDRILDIVGALNWVLGGLEFLGISKIDTSGLEGAKTDVWKNYYAMQESEEAKLAAQRAKNAQAILDQEKAIAETEAWRDEAAAELANGPTTPQWLSDALQTTAEISFGVWTDGPWFNPIEWAKLMTSLDVHNPEETAASLVNGLVDDLESMFSPDKGKKKKLKDEEQENFFDDLNPTGGHLDSVGKIDSSVNIAEEDIKLLRDIVARDFLLNLSYVTPQMQVNFGDVRETADVENITEVLADMLEGALASSLIYDS